MVEECLSDGTQDGLGGVHDADPRRLRSGGVAALVSVLLLVPSGAKAQELSAFATPMGVEVRIIDLSYGIQGSTAAQLLNQLRGGGAWVRFPYEYRWRYGTRQLSSVAGRATLHCGVTDFTLEFTVRATYPRWENRPADASPELLEAWGVFEEQLETLWQQQQDAMVSFAREARREAMRIEEGCPIIQQIINDRVQRSHDRAMEREREARERGERAGIRWPPEGYEELMVERPDDGDAEASDPGAAAAPGEVRRPGNAPPAGVRRPPPLPPEGRNAPTGGEVGIEAVLVADVGPTAMLGAAAALAIEGEMDYRGATGSADLEGTETLSPETTVRLQGLSEVVVAAVASGLEAEGTVDLEAPIASYPHGLDPALEGISLRDLLAHRSGLDDARPRDSVWTRVLEDLDDRAVFTDPDVLFSYSRYDYPVAVRVLEKAAGETLDALAGRLVFDPAGMTETRLEASPLGLPVTLTTTDDLIALGEAMMDGTVSAQPSRYEEGLWAAAGEVGGTYFGGVRWDTPAGVPRMSLMCEGGVGTDALAYQLYPEQGIVQVLWARPRSPARVWPGTSARLVLEDLGAKLGLASAIFEPRRLKGAAELHPDPTACDAPDWNPRVVSQGGEPVEPGTWAGRYLNGDRLVTLEERDGELWLTDELPLQIVRFEGDVHLATMNGLALYPLRLVTDEAGRRYVLLHQRAYIHDEDQAR